MAGGIVENNEPDFIYIVHFIQELTTTLLKKNAYLLDIARVKER